MGNILIANQQVQVAELASVIANAEEVFGVGSSVECRSILLPPVGGRGWTHATTLLRFGNTMPSPSRDVMWGRARCLSRVLRVAECSTAEGLANALTMWRE